MMATDGPALVPHVVLLFYLDICYLFLFQFHDRLLGKQGILVQLINNEVTDTETLKEALLCVECLTLK